MALPLDGEGVGFGRDLISQDIDEITRKCETLLKDKFVGYVVLRPRPEPIQKGLSKQQRGIGACDACANIGHRSISNLQRSDDKCPR